MRSRTPEFDQLLAVLRRETPSRPVLFDFIADMGVLQPGIPEPPDHDREARLRHHIRAYADNGYDFAPVPSWLTGFLVFPGIEHVKAASISQSGNGPIQTWNDFETY